MGHVPLKAKEYVNEMEKHTGQKLHRSQKDELIKNLQNVEYNKVSQEVSDGIRNRFSSSRLKLIEEWEDMTKQKWPRYTETRYSENGGIVFRKGALYQGHHIIPVDYGGPNTWWNLHPAHADVHQKLIHGSGSKFREVFYAKSPK